MQPQQSRLFGIVINTLCIGIGIKLVFATEYTPQFGDPNADNCFTSVSDY